MAGARAATSARTRWQEVDYKNVNQLRRYISEKGKIRNRRITGACRRHQRQVAVAVKRAREMALLPYVQGAVMEVILRSDVEKLGLKGDVVDVKRGYARNYLLPRQLAEVATPGRVAEIRRIEERARPARGRLVRAGRRDRGDADEDRPAVRGEGRPDRCALRLGHADRHRRGDLADAQDPRRPPQDRPRRDQAGRPLQHPGARVRGGHRRGEDPRRARRRRAAARGGAGRHRGRRAGRGGGRRARPRRGGAGDRGGARRGRARSSRPRPSWPPRPRRTQRRLLEQEPAEPELAAPDAEDEPAA